MRIVLAALAAIALGGAVTATIAKRDGDGAAARVTEVSGPGADAPASAFKGALRPPGAKVGDFALRDQDGRTVRLAGLRGKVVMLSPMYTTCVETCPVLAQHMQDALLELPRRAREQVVALALSVDPANDTPARARRFLRTRLVERHLDFLLGSQAQLREVWRKFGFSPQTRELEHNAWVVLIDRRGHQRIGFPIDYLTPEALVHDLRLLLRERT